MRRYVAKKYIAISGMWQHPIANRQIGSVLEHRAVLFDSIGWGPHPCHWCGKLVDWKKTEEVGMLIADHLDEDGHNNSLENLVPSCSRCNTRRAQAIEWLTRVGIPIPVEIFKGR